MGTFVSAAKAEELKRMLLPEIAAVGVFVDEERSVVADLLKRGVIDIAQLHGAEDTRYIKELKENLKEINERIDELTLDLNLNEKLKL